MAVTFDYEKFNKAGLKKVAAFFDKASLPVSDVSGDNKPKRENGYQTKTAEVTFESGQKLILKAKADGGIFQWKLNGKVLAIKNYMQLDTAIKEVAALVAANEPNYQKAKEKQLAKVKVAVPKVKAVNTTVTEQAEAFQASLEELTGQAETINTQLTEVKATVETKSGVLGGLRSELEAEKARTVALESQLEKAQQGIFESADDDESVEHGGVIFESVTLNDVFNIYSAKGSLVGNVMLRTAIAVHGKNIEAIDVKNKKVILSKNAKTLDDISENAGHDGDEDNPVLESAIFESSKAYAEAKRANLPFVMGEKGGKVVLRDFNTGKDVGDYEGPYFHVSSDSIMHTWLEDGERNFGAKPKGKITENAGFEGECPCSPPGAIMMCEVCNIPMVAMEQGFECPQCGQISVGGVNEGSLADGAVVSDGVEPDQNHPLVMEGADDKGAGILESAKSIPNLSGWKKNDKATIEGYTFEADPVTFAIDKVDLPQIKGYDLKVLGYAGSANWQFISVTGQASKNSHGRLFARAADAVKVAQEFFTGKILENAEENNNGTEE